MPKLEQAFLRGSFTKCIPEEKASASSRYQMFPSALIANIPRLVFYCLFPHIFFYATFLLIEERVRLSIVTVVDFWTPFHRYWAPKGRASWKRLIFYLLEFMSRSPPCRPCCICLRINKRMFYVSGVFSFGIIAFELYIVGSIFKEYTEEQL